MALYISRERVQCIIKERFTDNVEEGFESFLQLGIPNINFRNLHDRCSEIVTVHDRNAFRFFVCMDRSFEAIKVAFDQGKLTVEEDGANLFRGAFRHKNLYAFKYLVQVHKMDHQQVYSDAFRDEFSSMSNHDVDSLSFVQFLVEEGKGNTEVLRRIGAVWHLQVAPNENLPLSLYLIKKHGWGGTMPLAANLVHSLLLNDQNRF